MKTTITYRKIIQLLIKLLALSIISFNLQAAENIGTVIQSIGNVQATNNGKSRILKRGSKISEGDILITANATRSQIRMNDGALVALRPNTKFSFDSYKFNHDSEDSSIFSLIRGGFRTISGLIGKRNRKNYRVKTSVATIGVRGTHYGLTLCQQGDCGTGDNGTIDDGLYGSVIDGEIFTENDKGRYTFSNDEYFHVASSNEEPQSLLRPPGVIFDQGKLSRKLRQMRNNQNIAGNHRNRAFQVAAAFEAGSDQRRNFIQSLIRQQIFNAADDTTNVPVLTGSEQGDTMSFAFIEDLGGGSINQNIGRLEDDGTSANSFALNATALDDGFFIPVVAIKSNGMAGIQSLVLADARLNDVSSQIFSFNDGSRIDVGWGRWTGAYEFSINGTITPHTENLHYIVAHQTDASGNVIQAVQTPLQLSALTGFATYTFTDGTSPTDLNGDVATAPPTVSMGVNYGSNQIAGFNVSTTVAGNTYQAELASPVGFVSAYANGLSLGGNAGGPCPNCMGGASIAILGPQGEGAISSYGIFNPDINNAITGAAVLTKM